MPAGTRVLPEVQAQGVALMHNPSEIVHRWLCRGSNVPTEHVRAAMRQLERHEIASVQHYLDWSEEELERFLDVVDQQRLEFDEEDTHSNVRAAIARFLDVTVSPHVADPAIRKLAGRLRDARQTGTIMYRKDDQKFITMWDTKAGLPLLCPDDAREEAMRVQRRVVPAVLEALKQKGARAYYAVFTMPDAAPGKLRHAMKTLFKRFNALMRKCKRDGSLPFLGAYAVLEAPLSWDRDWHPHLNVILVTSGWFDYAKLRELWHWNVEVRRLAGTQAALEAALREIIKYSVRAVPEKSHAKAQASVGVLGQRDVAMPGVRQDDSSPYGAIGDGPSRRSSESEGNEAPSAAMNSSTHGVVDANCASLTADGQQAAQGAPALIEWMADEFIEWWRAHKGFRRSRGYGCLYRLNDPEPESIDGFTAIGTVRSEGGRLVRSFALLGSIPGDKSSTMTLVDRYRRAIQRLKGDPAETFAALQLTSEAMQAWATLKNQIH